MSGTELSRRYDISKLQSMVLMLSVAVSIVGFLGVQSRWGFLSVPSSVVLLTQMLLLIAGLVLGGRLSFSRLYAVWPYIAFGALAFASSFWAVDSLTSLKRTLLVFVPGVMMSVLAASVAEPTKSLRQITVLIIAIVIVSVAWNGVVYLFGDIIKLARFKWVWLWGDYGVVHGARGLAALGVNIIRFGGITPNPNTLALYSSLAIFFLLSLTLTDKFLSKVRTVAFVIMGVAILGTFSRSAFLFIIFATWVFVSVLKMRPLATRAALIFTFTAPFVIFAFILVHETGILEIPGFGVDKFRVYYDVFALSERGEIWGVILSAFRERAFVGVGFGLVQEALVEPAGFASAAHSIPFTMLGELGGVGFAMMYIVWAWPLCTLLRRPSADVYVTAGLAAILVGLFAHQCFDSSLFRYHPFHFVFSYVLGLAMNPALYQTRSEDPSGSIPA